MFVDVFVNNNNVCHNTFPVIIANKIPHLNNTCYKTTYLQYVSVQSQRLMVSSDRQVWAGAVSVKWAGDQTHKHTADTKSSLLCKKHTVVQIWLLLCLSCDPTPAIGYLIKHTHAENCSDSGSQTGYRETVQIQRHVRHDQLQQKQHRGNLQHCSSCYLSS